jgi:hypothetical protein
MSLPVRAFSALSAVALVLSAAACSPSDTSTPAASEAARPSEAAPSTAEAKVEPEDVAERLLTQLRDEDYAAAYETLSTGQARDVAANQDDLMTKIQSADTLVQEWSLEEPTFVTTEDGFSKVEVGGTVTFDDGGSGRVRVLMQALGLQADPWRIDEFELTRD